MRTFLTPVLAGLLAAAGITALAGPASSAPSCRGQAATIVGTSGDDDLSGNPLLADVVYLGAGNDTYRGDSSDDVICGGKGKDLISGGGGNDTVIGGAGKDRIGGADGNDRVLGGTGNDTVVEAAGDDKLAGGDGKDLLTYVNVTVGITVDGATATITGAGNDEYGQFELVRGTTQVDTMTGGPAKDAFDGLRGADTITGGGGEDLLIGHDATLRGGAGGDILEPYGGTAYGEGDVDLLRLRKGATGHGGVGNDHIDFGKGGGSGFGEAGNDLFGLVSRKTGGRIDGGKGANGLNLQKVKTGALINLAAGTARWKGGDLTLARLNLVRGSRGDDRITGTGGRDYLDGKAGDDVLRGLGDNDLLSGSKGFDRADGGPGGDICDAEVEVACEI